MSTMMMMIGTFCRKLCKTAEPIEMPFELCTRVGPRKHVLDGAQIPPHLKGQLLGERTCRGMPDDILP